MQGGTVFRRGCRCPAEIVSICLVDGDHIGKLDHAFFETLELIAGARQHQHQEKVGHVRDHGFRLAGTDGLDQNAVISAVAQQLGIAPNLLSAADVTSIMSTLTGTVNSLTGSILGQSGSYNTMPTLSISVPSSAAAGVYRGQLVVTLMDT